MVPLVFLVLFLGVGFVDNFEAVDKVSAQWLYLSIINFFYISYTHFFTENPIYKTFLKNKIILSYLVFLIFSLFSIFFSINKVESIIVFQRFIIGLITIYSISSILLSIKKNKLLIISYIFSACLIIEASYILSIFLENFDFTKEFGRSQLQKGFAANINIAAFSIAMKLPFLIFLYSKIQKNLIIKLLIIIALSISIFSMILTGSRGALLSLYSQIGIVLILLLILKNRFFIIKGFLIPYVFSFLISIAFSEYFLETLSVSYRTEQIIERGSKSRLRYYDHAISSFLDKPLSGVGIGNWKINSIDYDKEDIVGYVIPYHAHNDHLQLLAEIGLFGYLFYLLIFILSSFKIFYNIKKDRSLIILLLFFVVYAIDSNLNFPIARPMIQIILFSVLAYLIVYNNNETERISG